jgi:hypothetical protein
MQPAKLDFKFRYVQNRQATGLFARNGSVSESAISLDGESIPFKNILETSSRDSRFVVALTSGTPLGAKTRQYLQNNRYVAIDVSKIKADELKKHVDHFGSAIWAESHRQQLANEGKEHLFSTLVCPRCQATIDLSDLERTAYVYCFYCGSVVNHQLKVVSDSNTYNVCDECHMYDRVRGYTVFYFYFLLVVYGYSINRRFVCDTCATRIAQRALLTNLIFVLGIPSAIYMWIKAQTGREPYFQDLAKANKLARSGKYQEADEIYDKLFSLYPDHPGLLMNKGLGHLHGKDSNGDVALLTRALKACANYFPAIALIQKLQQAAAQPRKA